MFSHEIYLSREERGEIPPKVGYTIALEGDFSLSLENDKR